MKMKTALWPDVVAEEASPLEENWFDAATDDHAVPPTKVAVVKYDVETAAPSSVHPNKKSNNSKAAIGCETESSDNAETRRRVTTNIRNMTLSERTKRIIWAFIFVLLTVALGLLIASLKKVPSTEYGLQYNIHKKQLEDAAKSGGLFLGPPGYQFIKFPSTFITVDLNDRTCVSNDGLLVTFSVTFQYQMTESNLYDAIIKYRDYHKWASTVEAAGLSAIHHSCAEYMVTEFQAKRGIIQNRMEENLRLKLEGSKSADGDDDDQEGVHAVAVSLQLRYVKLPAEYNTAVAEKQAAEEDIALAIAQRKQETTKANTELLRAKEEARKIIDTANNEAEVLLTEARLKAEETLYSFEKEAEALVEVKNALNLTTEGVLAYLSNKLLGEVTNLTVSTGEPAKLSRRDEL